MSGGPNWFCKTCGYRWFSNTTWPLRSCNECGADNWESGRGKQMSRVVYRIRDTVNGGWKITEECSDRPAEFPTAESAKACARYLKRWRVVKVTIKGCQAEERAVLEAAVAQVVEAKPCGVTDLEWVTQLESEWQQMLDLAPRYSGTYRLRVAVARMLKARGGK